MVLENLDKLLRNLSSEILLIDDFNGLGNLASDYFKSKEAKASQFFNSNPDLLISRAYKHDFMDWMAHLIGIKNLIQNYNLSELEILDNPEIFKDLNFYKSAIGFLSFLGLPNHSNLDLPIKSSSLEFQLKKLAGEHILILPEDLPTELPFSHFYLIWNFVRNSYDAFKDNNISDGVIKVEYFSEDYCTSFSVMDDARGINDVELPEIFGNYSSKRRKNEFDNNVGFGLFGANNIVKRLGGEIGVITKYNDLINSFMPSQNEVLPLYDDILEGYDTKFWVILPKNKVKN